MNRNQKIALFTLLAVVSFLVAGAVIYEIAAPRISKGSAAATPVTTMGWIQLAFSALAAAGFSGAGIWQGVAAFIESRIPSVLHQVAPSVSDRTVTAVVDVTKLTAFLALLRQVTDEATRTKLTEAARLACDNLRDDLFPVLAPQTPVAPNLQRAS